ncbi:uncharacterized protein LOC107610852 [Arachis ipaensis]|uniref:uncharacterized protein LOC107610852 n=1 Tax=Arachis ipaensis TaxID=130454 RepID=UPI0007AEFCFA|nr:uncharacterized protein LOC107610852 [Arachis ipaensis]
MIDKSIKYAHGIVENVLVKVRKFFLLADFVILDMEEDDNALIILGSLFLAIRRALIDVEKGELILRMHDEHLVFHIFNIMYHSSEKENCIKVESIDPSLQEPPDKANKNLQPKPPFVEINITSPDIKPKFGVGCASSKKEEEKTPTKKTKG